MTASSSSTPATLPPSGTAYIIGPMAGYDDFNHPAFDSLAETLRGWGYCVKNPAENFNRTTTLPYTCYIRQSIADVTRCDFVVALPGWRNSRGARLEGHIAAMLDIPVFELDDAGLAVSMVAFDRFGNPL